MSEAYEACTACDGGIEALHVAQARRRMAELGVTSMSGLIDMLNVGTWAWSVNVSASISQQTHDDMEHGGHQNQATKPRRNLARGHQGCM